MNEVSSMSPQLPLPILLAVTMLLVPMLWLAIRQTRGLAALFLLSAVWLRVVSGAFNEFTFARLGPGLSVNALMSVATVLIGLMLIPRRHFTARWIVPIYGVILLVFISGLLNNLLAAAIEMAFKWGYVIVVVAAAHQAIRENGLTQMLKLLMLCYVPIFIFQALSLVLGVAKAGELDGSASYIGGYFHEGVFSVMGLTFATLAYLARGMSYPLRLLLIMAGTASIVLANYRTTIIAIVPLVVGFFAVVGVSRFLPRQRIVVLAFAAPVVSLLAVGALSSDTVQSRFLDVLRVFAEGEEFLKPQSAFTVEESRVLSGRLFIWAGYIVGYLNGGDLQLVFGLGPNAWVPVMRLYAHNTVVSFLYELGPLGVIALLAVWGTAVFGAIRIPNGTLRLQCLLALAGFIILNMATMPHWQIEGNILYAIIFAVILHHGETRQPIDVPPVAKLGERQVPFASVRSLRDVE
jgi:hypothetical protein